MQIKPYDKAILFLSVSFLIASFPWWSQDVFWLFYPAVMMGATWVWSRILSLWKPRPMVIKTDIISAWIILLIVMPSQNWMSETSLWTFIVILLALLWKRMVRFRMSPVINPAALALLVMGYLLPLVGGVQLFYTWWGTAFYGIFGVFWMLAWLVFGLKAWRKQVMAWAFIGWTVVFSVLYCWINQHMSPVEMLFYMLQNATMIFFASWMLIEPKTSPVLVKDQLGIAFLSAGFYWVGIHFALDYSLLWTLLFANGLHFILGLFRSRKG